MNDSICIDCSPTGFPNRAAGFKKIRKYIDGWRIAAMCLCLCVLLPLAVIFIHLLHPETEIWQHLARTLLADLMINTLLLSGGVLTGTFGLGVGLAWLTGVCDFPGAGFCYAGHV